MLKVFKVSNFKEQRVLSQTVISWKPGHKGTVVRKVNLLTLQWSHMTTVTLKPFDPWNHTMNKLIFDQNLFNQTDWQLNQIWNQLSSLSITVHGLQWVFLPCASFKNSTSWTKSNRIMLNFQKSELIPETNVSRESFSPTKALPSATQSDSSY